MKALFYVLAGAVVLLLLGGFIVMIEESVANTVTPSGASNMVKCRAEIKAWSLYETPVFDEGETKCRIEGKCFLTGVKFMPQKLAFWSEDYILKARTSEKGLQVVTQGTAYVYNDANVEFNVCTSDDSITLELYNWEGELKDRMTIGVTP